MWRLNVDRGRQWWTYDATATPPDSFSESLEEARQHFATNRHVHKHSSDRILRLLASHDFLSNGTGGNPLPPPDDLQDSLSRSLFKGISYFATLQTEDGHWAGDYAGPMFLMPGMIITSYITHTPFHDQVKKEMLRYLRNHQNEDGGFGLHIEHHSTMFGTALNYVSMRLLNVSAEDEACSRARKWILDHGGVGGIPGWGKFWLAVLGAYEWDGLDPLTPEFWLLPYAIPCHPARFWCHCRVVYLPMSHLYGKRATGEITPLVKELRQELYGEDYDRINWSSFRGLCCEVDIYVKRPKLQRLLWSALSFYENVSFPGKQWLRNRALKETLELVMNEDDNTNHIDIGPVNKVINYLCVWFDDPHSERAKNHAERLKDYLWLAEDGMKMQGYNGSQLWDTSFTTQAMMKAGRETMSPFIKTLSKAHNYVEISQVLVDPPNRERYYRHTSKGAWPFSTRAHGWPIADCTGEGLAAALLLQGKHGHWIPKKNVISAERLQLAAEMIMGYQNVDGGWATYELTRGPKWLEFLNPSEVFGDIMIDYSYVECTSSAVKGLGLFRAEFPDHTHRKVIDSSIDKGIKYIESQQRDDGSWYGSWGICFLYAAWFAVDAYTSTGLTLETSESMRKACEFVLSKQHDDGGWGESYLSSETKEYNQSKNSLVVSTGWALLVLSLAKWPKKEPLQHAADFLMKSQDESGDWPQQNICGVFNRNCMISYSQYRNIFPIWALAEFRHNYAEG